MLHLQKNVVCAEAEADAERSFLSGCSLRSYGKLWCLLLPSIKTIGLVSCMYLLVCPGAQGNIYIYCTLLIWESLNSEKLTKYILYEKLYDSIFNIILDGQNLVDFQRRAMCSRSKGKVQRMGLQY